VAAADERFAKPVMAAGALFVNEAGRVLLVKPTYKETWDIPGGYVEPGESPTQACAREIKEELALTRCALRLVSVDWAPSDREGDKLLFIFDAGTVGPDEARIVLAPDELRAWEWVTDADLARYLVPRLERRIRSSLTARDDGIPVYLEHGVPALHR